VVGLSVDDVLDVVVVVVEEVVMLAARIGSAGIVTLWAGVEAGMLTVIAVKKVVGDLAISVEVL